MLERLRQDLKKAMKARDSTAVATLRMTISEAENRRIELGRELEEEDVVEVVHKAVKMREEAAREFEQGGRQERAAAERAEAEVLRRYLPRQLEDEELRAAVDEVIADTGAGGPGDMGTVMKELMSRYRGRIDGRTASAVVRQRLES